VHGVASHCVKGKHAPLSGRFGTRLKRFCTCPPREACTSWRSRYGTGWPRHLEATAGLRSLTHDPSSRPERPAAGPLPFRILRVLVVLLTVAGGVLPLFAPPW